MQQILTSPRPTGGGDATTADSGAHASVRLAGRTSSTQLFVPFFRSALYEISTVKFLPNSAQYDEMTLKIHL